jgi:lia operon protein LiaG
MIFKKFPIKLFLSLLLVAILSLPTGLVLAVFDSDYDAKLTTLKSVDSVFIDKPATSEFTVETGAAGLDNVEEIYVNVVAKDITITAGGEGQLRYEITGQLANSGSGKILEITTGAATLTLDAQDEKQTDNRYCDCYLRIVIPATFQGSIRAKSVSGNQKIKLYTLKNLRTKTVSGDITIDAGDVGSLSAETVSGDIKTRIEGTSAASTPDGSLELKTTSGDVEIFTEVVRQNIQAQTLSGDVSLNLSEQDSFSYEFGTLSGDLKLIPNRGRAPEETKHLAGAIGDGRHRVEVETTSGDTTLELR